MSSADLRRSLGRWGEDAAAAWYLERGYEVVDRNWRCREGELDLVVRRGHVVVFCEVKTRSSDAFGLPPEAVTATKRARIRRLAVRWLSEHRGRGRLMPRFDVASVFEGNVTVIEAAF